jgi:hypothetical protein
MIIEDIFAADRVAVRFRSVQKHAKAFFGDFTPLRTAIVANIKDL